MSISGCLQQDEVKFEGNHNLSTILTKAILLKNIPITLSEIGKTK